MVYLLITQHSSVRYLTLLLLSNYSRAFNARLSIPTASSYDM